MGYTTAKFEMATVDSGAGRWALAQFAKLAIDGS
jgi:hypothetical protein